MGAKAIKLGSWYKHSAYCLDWNVNQCGICAMEINVMEYFKPVCPMNLVQWP